MREYEKGPETEVENMSNCHEVAFYDSTELTITYNIATFLILSLFLMVKIMYYPYNENVYYPYKRTFG